MDSRPHVILAGIHHQIRLLILRVLIRIIDTGETLDFARARTSVDPALVRLLAVLQRRGDVNEIETPVLLDQLTRSLARILERRDRGGNDSGAGACHLRRHPPDTLDVLVAVLAREAELGGELGAHGLAEEQGDGAAALLVEGDVERARDGVFARVGVAREEDGEALLVPRRVGFAQDAHDFRVGEPFRDVAAGAEAAAELRAGDVERADFLGHFVFGLVFVGVREVGHLLEGHDLDPEFVSVLLDGELGVVGAVDFLALPVLARAGVVTADDEVRGTVILADDGVPDGFAWAAHAHGQGKETEDSHSVRVAGEQGLVHTHASEVVDVTGLGHTDDGVDEHIGLPLASSADCELAVGAVHGVAGLESDHARPAELVEVQTELSGGIAQADVVVVHEAVDSLEFAADVVVACNVEQVLDRRVVSVAAKDLLGLLFLVRLVHVVHGHDGEIAVIARVTEGDTCSCFDPCLVDLVFLEIKTDGHGEEVAVRESVVLDDAIVILLVHEAFQR